MKRTISSLSLLLVMAFGCFAQTAMTTTTNTPALTATTKSFVVASATNITGPLLAQSNGGVGSSTAANLTVLFIDREAMDVLSVSSTTVTVKRGTRGTAPAAHAAASKVWVGAAGQFINSTPSGACTRNVLAYVPVISLVNGRAYDCSASPGKWGNFGDQAVIGGVLASQAGAMTAANAIIEKIHHVSGTNAITSWDIPAGLRDGDTFITIPDGAFTWTAAGNIVSTGTAVVGKAIVWTYDATTAKLYPSY